jgi:diguanylate cyclase (GGDEF)-like protein/PAS domain S-box-containing protein
MTDTGGVASKQNDVELRLRAELDRRNAVLPAMFHSIDRDGRLVAVSDVWLAKLGYSRAEVLGRCSADFLTPESRDYAVSTVLPDFFHSGRCENVPYKMVCRDGRIIDVLLSGVLDRDPSGDGPVSLAVITDVTTLRETERKLASSEERYRKLVEDQSELVSLATTNGELLFVNRAYAALYQRRADEMVGRNLFEFIPSEQHAGVAKHFKALCEGGGSIEDQNQIVMPDGKTRWVGWTNQAFKDAEGQVTILSVGRDIEERVAAEQRLHDSEARYRLLAENSTDMVFQLDRDFVRRYASPACREILGYEPEELTGSTPLEVVHPDDADRLRAVLQSLLAGRSASETIISRARHRDGRWIWLEGNFRALKDQRTGETSGIVATVRDVSARKAVEDALAEANSRLQSLAMQDGLTALANRRAFDDALLREYRRAKYERKRLGLVMIDVDSFKAFNDQYGHFAGDDCLRRIGETIRTSVRGPADLVARYGGEEFAVLLPNTDEHGAALVADRIREAVLALGIEHRASGKGAVTVSAGVATAVGIEGGEADGAYEANALLQAADRALYCAKRGGRNAVGQVSSSGSLTLFRPAIAA